MAKEGGQTFNITHNGKDVLKFPTTKDGWKELILGETSNDAWHRAGITFGASVTAIFSNKPELQFTGGVYLAGVVLYELLAVKKYQQELDLRREQRKMAIIEQSTMLAENLRPLMGFVGSKNFGFPTRLKEEGVDELKLERKSTENRSVKKVALTLKGETVEEVIPTLEFWQVGGKNGQLTYIESGLQSKQELYNLKLANYAMQEIKLHKSENTARKISIVKSQILFRSNRQAQNSKKVKNNE